MKNRYTILVLLICTTLMLFFFGCFKEAINTTDTSSSQATYPEKATINAISRTSITNNTIILSWITPTDLGKKADGTKASLRKYQLYYKVGSTITIDDRDKHEVILSSVTATSATVTGLASVTQYAFIVVITNSEGKSSTSDTMVATTESSKNAPGEASINSIDAVHITSNAITLSWNAPDPGKKANGTAANIIDYKVYYAKGSTASMTGFPKTVKAPTTTTTISGLKGLTQYAFIVVTTNSEQQSSISKTITATTKSVITAPSVISINPIVAENITKNSISISWKAPKDLGRKADGTQALLSKYQLYYKKGGSITMGDKDKQEVTLPSKTSMSVTVNNLTTGIQYSFIVVVTNSEGRTSTSEVITAIATEATAPGLAIISIDTTDTSKITSEAIPILWKPPIDLGKKADGTKAILNKYELYYKKGNTIAINDNDRKKIKLTSPTATNATPSGLTPNTQYAFIVVTTNNAQLSSISEVKTAYTVFVPKAPSNATLMLGAIGSTSVSLAWTEPSGLGQTINGKKASIEHYEIFYQNGPIVDYSVAIRLTTQTKKELIISSLARATTYTFAVRTTNSANKFSDSNVVTISTKNYTKLDEDGKTLNNQNATWSSDSSGHDNGSKAAGTQWSCVKDDQGTKDAGDDLYWEIKTNNSTADLRDKDIKYKWGGLTALGRNTSDDENIYNDDWNEAIEHANGTPPNTIQFCGFNDWRVPTRAELRTLVDYTTNSPAFDDSIFPNMAQDAYWSSSPYANSNLHAWTIDFEHGNDYTDNRSYEHYLRLVRGGTSLSTQDKVPNEWKDTRYTVNSDGTIIDTETSLMWKQCSEGLSGSTCEKGTAGKYNYDNAKMQAQKESTANEGVGFANFKDWRLPTINELESLIALDRYDLSINSTVFPNTEPNYYMTLNFSNNDDVRVLNFRGGADFTNNRFRAYYLRLVRGGK